MGYQTIESPDRDQVVATMEVLSDRVASLMEAIVDWDAHVHGSDAWTVTDLIRHMSVLPELYADAPGASRFAWSSTAAGMAETNAKALVIVAERDRSDLAGDFRTNMPALLAHLRAADPDVPLPWHAGQQLRPGDLGGVAIGEWLVHGWELAKTIGAPWEVRPEDACLVLAAFNAVLPGWLDAEAVAGHSGRYEIRLRGTGQRLEWTFADGVLMTRTEPGATFRPDTIIWAEPSALLLYFYRRTNLWSNALRGAMIAGGRRPLRAFTVRTRFHPA